MPRPTLGTRLVLALLVVALVSATVPRGDAQPKGTLTIAITDPTDKSNSPAVIRSVIASAMSPSSTVKVSVFETFSADRNDGLIAVNTTSSSTSRTSGPNSGMATSR